MTFSRNENYSLGGKPEIEKVTIRIVPDDAVRKTMILQGDADIDMWINVNTANELQGSDVVKVSLSPTDRWVMRLFMNQAAKGSTDAAADPHPVLSDVRVRQAISFAIDRERIVREVVGSEQAVVARTLLPPGLPAHEVRCDT